MRLTPLLAIALLGCQQAANPVPSEQDSPSPGPAASTAPEARPPAPSPTSEAITEAENLVGEYRIAAIDGGDINLPHGVTAKITSDGIHVASDCVNLSWNYIFEGTSLVTEQLFPRDSCGRELLPEEEAIVTAFNSANDVGRTPANGIEFSGSGHSVLLFSQ